MIRYTLKCKRGHRFDSWFASAEAFDTLSQARQVTCPDCGTSDVEKSLMAPKVRPTDRQARLTEAETEREKAIAALREKVETTSDYVGLEFATEARAMHDGDAPHRAIWGEAKVEDAKALLEDGVPVAPLPFTPRAKTN